MKLLKRNSDLQKYKGNVFFHKPARQLFTHSASKQLIAKEGITGNAKLFAEMLLESTFCDMSLIGIKQSLTVGQDGGSLLYQPGCTVILLVNVENVELLGFMVVMNFNVNCLEQRFVRMLERRHMSLPKSATWLELICVKPHSRNGPIMCTELLRYLSKTDCLLTNPSNPRAQKFFYERMKWSQFFPDAKSLAILKSPDIPYYHNLIGFNSENFVKVCSRSGIRDPTRVYWECEPSFRK